MAVNKIKVRNKDLRKADEIVNLPQRTVAWVQARMQWIVAGVIAVVVVLVMIWAFTSYGQVKERRAQMQYAQVLEKLNQQGKAEIQGELWQTLIPELQAVSEQFRGTPSALSAQLDLARAYFQTGQFDQALQLDLKSVRELSANAALQSFVRYRLAMTYQQLSQPDEAIAQLESLQSSAWLPCRGRFTGNWGSSTGRRTQALRPRSNTRKLWR